MIIFLAFRIEVWESSLFKPKLQVFEIATMNKDDFKSFDPKIISGKHF